MLSWLVIFALIAVVVHLDRRLGRLERSLESWSTPEYEPADEALPTEAESWSQEAPAFAQPDAEPEPAPQWTEPPQDSLPEYIDDDDAPARSWIPQLDFEELFGRKLPIWAGGITLAVAGMLIVKLSIDSGLMTPPVRVLAGLGFGSLLIAAAELALRQERRIDDVRVRQSLAGAGVASFYASVLVATNVYGLIGPFPAMLGMAAVTALALFLATRFGAPSALLGLAGGLAAPALIGSAEPNVPLLALYLALAVGGLCAVARDQRWAWLGISALVGGFGWGLALLVGGALDVPGSIALGLYVLLLAVGIPALGFAGDRRNQLQLIAGIVGAAQMAALVATGGFALLNWGLFGLLATASLWLARREPALERLPAVALLVAVLLLGAWPYPDQSDYALVLAGTVAIFAPPAVLRLWNSRESLLDAAQLAALGLAAFFLPMLQFYWADGSTDLEFGMLALALAAALAGCAALGWHNPARHQDARFAILATATALLAAAAASLLAPSWALGIAVAAIGLGLLHLGQNADDRRFEPIAWTFAAVGALQVLFADFFNTSLYSDAIDALRWTLLAGVTALFAWRAHSSAGRRIAQFLAPLFLCGGLAAVAPELIDSLIASLLLLGLAFAARRNAEVRLAPAMAGAALVVLVATAAPFLTWSLGAALSLAGEPLFVSDLPSARSAFLDLLLPGLLGALSVVIAFDRLRQHERILAIGFATILAGVGAHILYKQVFAIGSFDAFVALGLAERTVWEVLLLGAALVTARFAGRGWALAPAIAAAAHLCVYTLLLHNPLWATQAVGGWPLFNMLLPAYALALGLTVAAQRSPLADLGNMKRVLGVTQMVVITLFAFSTLRQLFHGTMLVGVQLSAAEEIGRSMLAIALAIGFLLWGIARGERDWRLASLALMLAAVGKVFLFDASGLEGVTRIAPFIALGLSLIGIGWIYARHLGLDHLRARSAGAGSRTFKST